MSVPSAVIQTRSKTRQQAQTKNLVTPNQIKEKGLKNINLKNQKMRPYKKRSFQSHLQSTENNMEAENSEDSEKQVSSSPPMEDGEKDKDKDGETKKRKRWKRKISRKQFRHHDIKLFTPGEYRTSTLLKQKDTSPTVPKKPDVVSRESITDLIVTTLGGQKQGTTQKKGLVEEVVDSTTKNDSEENNNTNGVQNNNVGKHNLPAIIMETPSSVRRRSVDNTNIPKTNFKTIDPKVNRRMSADIPMPNFPEKIPQNPITHPQMETVRQEKTTIRNNGSTFNAEGSISVDKINRNNISNTQVTMYPAENIPENHLTSKKPALKSPPIETGYVTKNTEYREHLEQNKAAERLPEQRLIDNLQPMDTTSREEQIQEPENLSLKRRFSTEIPVDLSTKNLLVEQSNHDHQKSHQNDVTERIEANKNEESFTTPWYHDSSGRNPTVAETPDENDYLEEYVRNNLTNHESRTSPKVNRPDARYLKENEPNDSQSKDQPTPSIILTDRVVKLANLNMWKEVLQRLLKQKFTLQVMDLIAHAYEQVEKAKEDTSIPPELKLKSQKLLSEAYNYIYAKLKQLNIHVDPAFVIKILGESENTPEKDTLKNYIENIQRIRALAITEPIVPTTTTSEPSRTYSQHYREFLSSPPLPYSIPANQPRYHKNVPAESSSMINIHPAPVGHASGPSPKAREHHGYSRESPMRNGDYSKAIGHIREPSPRIEDHPMLPRTGDYPVPQGRSRESSPRTSGQHTPPELLHRTKDYPVARNSHPMPYGHFGEPVANTADYSASQALSKRLSPSSGDHRKLPRPSEAWLQTTREFMQQDHAQRPSPRSTDHYIPLEHTSESSLRARKHYMPPRYSERPSARPNDHSMPLSYPKDLPLSPAGAYTNYLMNDLNPSSFLTPNGYKEPIIKSSTQIGRPRSKSNRNIENKIGAQPHLRRSVSNPQHAATEKPLLTHPYMDGGAANRMPPPRVPTSTQNFYAPSAPLLPNVIKNKELTISPSAIAPSKHTVPSLYSEIFYQNLQKHLAKGNPLAVSVHPDLKYMKKVPNTPPNLHRLEIKEGHRETVKVSETPQKTPEQYHPNKPHVPLVTSSIEENITSSTDQLEIINVTNTLNRSAYENAATQKTISPKPAETLKSIPVAVIVVDKSMQITKETTTSSGGDITKQESPSIDISDENDVRISISSNSNENTSSSEENLKQAVDKEQDENNTEFLVWLEKLKKNEKLKSKFLSQMGIIKKEEPIFMPSSDPIEIIDSDEEISIESPAEKETVKTPAEDKSKISSNEMPNPPKESLQNQPNCKEKSISHEIPVRTTTATRTPNIPEAIRISSSPPELPKAIKIPSPRESLSKKDYIPPIPLPYISSSSISENKKVIYSPEIEPISPVGNEPGFVFPDATNGPKLVPPLPINTSERSNVFPDSVTSPTYHKRKNAPDFPGYQSEENANAKPTNYPNNNSVKRRKSLDRPEITKSPRVAPSGKLCYVRENHMFLRYFDDTQVELFIRNLSTQDEELLRSTGIDPERLKNTHQPSNFGVDQLAKTEIIYLPRDVEFSEKEDIPEVEEFIKETSLVEQFVPKDFADFYRYVTGFQIIKNKHPVSLQTFLTMYNTNRTSELLRKYLQRDEVGPRTIKR